MLYKWSRNSLRKSSSGPSGFKRLGPVHSNSIRFSSRPGWISRKILKLIYKGYCHLNPPLSRTVVFVMFVKEPFKFAFSNQYPKCWKNHEHPSWRRKGGRRIWSDFGIRRLIYRKGRADWADMRGITRWLCAKLTNSRNLHFPNCLRRPKALKRA